MQVRTSCTEQLLATQDENVVPMLMGLVSVFVVRGGWFVVCRLSMEEQPDTVMLRHDSTLYVIKGSRFNFVLRSSKSFE